MQTVSKSEQLAKPLIESIANETHEQTSKIRWFHVGGDNPRAVIVMLRGANRKRLKTISANIDKAEWESWQPVLGELLAERKATGKRRISHKKLQTGKL